MQTAETGRLGTMRRAVVAGLCALLVTPFMASPQTTSYEVERIVTVIVQGFKWGDAQAAVDEVDGKVTQELPIVNGVTARVGSGDIERLREQPGIVNVERNATVEFQGRPDYRTPQRIQKVVRADKLWRDGVTGEGVTVAIVDTGVYADHPDLAGRVTHCEDFTHEANTEAHCADTFGHGTFMAGLVAGDGTSSNGDYKGTAPDAEIVSIKVAGYDGSTDVSHVLAGIQWAVAHKDIYDIDILSLSVGSDSTVGTRLSPLSFAVERAWASGIVVVVSSGNRGPEMGTVTSPADNPYVITVGASNDENTSNTVSDDQVPVFSGRGPTAEGLTKPDVVSPGVSTVSLRSPGSYIDENFGSTARVGTSYFKGTGTSMSNATVAGTAALMLDRNPLLIPNQVKHRLTDTARSIGTSDPNLAGSGLIDAYAAAMSDSLGMANQGISPSTGLGSLDAARGSIDVWVETPAGSVALDGEVTAQTSPDAIDPLNPLGLVAYDPVQFTSTGWDATRWNATRWNTEEWMATRWNGAEFEATRWNGTRWNGTRWNNTDWDATRWNDTDWDATRWNATRWNSAWYAVAWD